MSGNGGEPIPDVNKNLPPAPPRDNPTPCMGHADIFLSDDVEHDQELAADICRSGCPIFDECRDWALRNKPHGTWGGTTDKDRALMRPRKSNYCHRGHLMLKENVWLNKDHRVFCRECHRADTALGRPNRKMGGKDYIKLRGEPKC